MPDGCSCSTRRGGGVGRRLSCAMAAAAFGSSLGRLSSSSRLRIFCASSTPLRPCISPAMDSRCEKATFGSGSEPSDSSGRWRLSSWLRKGWRSFCSARASIWRTRSRVMLSSVPISSSVRGVPSSRPKRSFTMQASRGASELSRPLSASSMSCASAVSSGSGWSISRSVSPTVDWNEPEPDFFVIWFCWSMLTGLRPARLAARIFSTGTSR
mmetsp:Transcript_36525/g.114470  ORF Transcript_36525/g.114470 Transcript_36525/m.114470 type:complete len:212 (+) Transcript_36525:1108-1743(+)